MFFQILLFWFFLCRFLQFQLVKDKTQAKKKYFQKLHSLMGSKIGNEMGGTPEFRKK